MGLVKIESIGDIEVVFWYGNGWVRKTFIR